MILTVNQSPRAPLAPLPWMGVYKVITSFPLRSVTALAWNAVCSRRFYMPNFPRCHITGSTNPGGLNFLPAFASLIKILSLILNNMQMSSIFHLCEIIWNVGWKHLDIPGMRFLNFPQYWESNFKLLSPCCIWTGRCSGHFRGHYKPRSVFITLLFTELSHSAQQQNLTSIWRPASNECSLSSWPAPLSGASVCRPAGHGRVTCLSLSLYLSKERVKTPKQYENVSYNGKERTGMRYIFGQVWLIRKFHSRRICSHFIRNAYVTISSFSLYFAVSAAGLVSVYTWLPRCLATGAHRPYLHSPSSCPYLWQPIISARGTLDDEFANKPWAAVEGKTHKTEHCRVVQEGWLGRSTRVQTLVTVFSFPVMDEPY